MPKQTRFNQQPFAGVIPWDGNNVNGYMPGLGNDRRSRPLIEVLGLQPAFPGCPLDAETYSQLRQVWQQALGNGVGGIPNFANRLDEWNAIIHALQTNQQFQEIVLRQQILVDRLKHSFVGTPDQGKVTVGDVAEIVERTKYWLSKEAPWEMYVVANSSALETFVNPFSGSLDRRMAIVKLNQKDTEVAVVLVNGSRHKIEVFNPFSDYYPIYQNPQPGKDPSRLNRLVYALLTKYPQPTWTYDIKNRQGNGQYQDVSEQATLSRTLSVIEYVYRRFRGASHGEAAEKSSSSRNSLQHWFGYKLPPYFAFLEGVYGPSGPANSPSGPGPSGPGQPQPLKGGLLDTGNVPFKSELKNGLNNSFLQGDPFGYPSSYSSEFKSGSSGTSSALYNANPSGPPTHVWNNQQKLNYSRLADMRLTAIYMAKYIASLVQAIQSGDPNANILPFQIMQHTLLSSVITYSDPNLLKSLLTETQSKLHGNVTTDMREFIPSNLWERLLSDIQNDPLTSKLRQMSQNRDARGELLVAMFEEILEMVPMDKLTDFLKEAHAILNTNFLVPLKDMPDSKHIMVPGRTEITTFLVLSAKSDQYICFAVAFMRELETLLRQLNVQIVYKKEPALNRYMYVSQIVQPLSPSMAKDVVEGCEMALKKARELLREFVGPNMAANPVQALLYQSAMQSQGQNASPFTPFTPSGSSSSSLLSQFQQLNGVGPATGLINASTGSSMNMQWLRPSWRNDRKPFQLPHYTANPVTNRMEDLIVLLQNDLDARELEANLLKNKLQYWVFPVNASKVYEIEVTDALKEYSISDEDMRYLWGREEFKQALANSVFVVMLILGPNYQRRLEEPVVYRIFNSLAQFRAANDNAEDAGVICELIYCMHMAFMSVGHVLRPTVKDYIRRVTNECRRTSPTSESNSFLVQKEVMTDKGKVIDYHMNDKYTGPLKKYYEAWKKEMDQKKAL